MKVRLRRFYLITWLTDFTAFLVIFAVSRELAERGFDLLSMGLVGAGISGTNVFSNFLSGRISDRVGRRRTVVVGLLLMFLGLGGCAFLSQERWYFYASYFLCGGALGSVYPPLIAWMNQGREGHDEIAQASRTIVGFCVAWNLGMTCGQISGGWLFNEWGPRWPLFVAMGSLTAALCLVLFTRGEAAIAPSTRGVHNVELAASSNPSASFAKLGWIANVGGAFSMAAVLHLFPKLLVGLDIDPAVHGAMLASSRVVVIAMYLLMYKFPFWQYRLSTALATQITGICGLVILSVAATAWGLTLGLTCIAVLLGYNYFAGLCYSVTSRDDTARGAASGMHEGTLALGFTGGTLIGGIAGSYYGVRAPFLLAAGMIAATSIVQCVAYRIFVCRQKRLPLAPDASAKFDGKESALEVKPQE